MAARSERHDAATVNAYPFAAPVAIWVGLPPPATRMMEAGAAVLTTSRDAFEVYPTLWKNNDAARKAFQRAKITASAVPDGLRRVDYLRAGRGQQPAVAWLALACDPDEVRTLLVDRLGPLARWDVAPMPQQVVETPAPPALLITSSPSPLGHNGSPPMLPEPPALGDLPRIEAGEPIRPEVAAYAAPDGATLLAKCPFCNKPHRHGGFGPRHAHCASFVGRIYVLRDAGPASATMLALPMEEKNAPATE